MDQNKNPQGVQQSQGQGEQDQNQDQPTQGSPGRVVDHEPAEGSREKIQNWRDIFNRDMDEPDEDSDLLDRGTSQSER
jgi:hypothetical protein